MDRRRWPGSARAALPIVAILVVRRRSSVRRLAAAGDTLGFDFLAYHQAAVRLLDGQPLYDMTFTQTGGFGLFYYPPTFAPLILPFGAAVGDGRRSGSGSAISIASFLVGVAVLPVSRTVRWWIVLLAGLSWPFVYAVKLGQVGPILFLLFAIGWRWLDDPIRLGVERRARCGDQAPAGAPLRLGRPDRSLAGGRDRGGRRSSCSRSLATLLAGVGAWSRLR